LLGLYWGISIFRYKIFSTDSKVKGLGVNTFIKIIFVLLLGIFAYTYFGLINVIYCDDFDDDIVVSDSANSNNNNSNNEDDKNYHFSISKSFVREGFDSIFKTLSDSLPQIIAGFSAAKIGTAVVKSSKSLPPIQRGALGVIIIN
jgi:hypothetical protein